MDGSMINVDLPVPAITISPSNPNIGSILTAIITNTTKKVERYFWFSKVNDSDGIRALAGNFDKYTPTKKLRGSCIGVTVHFIDGSTLTSLPTQPCTAPIKIGHSGNADISPPPNIPKDESLRTCKILSYDTSLFDFRSVVSEYLGLGPNVALEQLHENFTHPKPKMKPQQHYKAIHDSANWSRDGQENCVLVEMFDRFVREVVRPAMCRDGVGDVIYQAKPSLRVQPPGSTGIRRHRDSEYHHQSGEVNWWIPLTECYDSNTLQLESSPDLGDFKPLNLQYGQLARFYGNQCLHGTLLNETPITRVSLDFRVVCDVDFDKNAAIGLRADGSQRFELGGYYASTATSEDNTSGSRPCFELRLPFKLPSSSNTNTGSPEACAIDIGEEAASRVPRSECALDHRWVIVQALPYIDCSLTKAIIARCSTCLYRVIAADMGSISFAPKQWREWRSSCLEIVVHRLECLLQEKQETIGAAEHSDLEKQLGLAAKSGVPPSFASSIDRKSYTIKHLRSRVGHLADILTLNPAPTWLHQAVVALTLSRRDMRTVSLGGGPGFDAVAVTLTLKYLSGTRSSPARTVVFDSEIGWATCAEALSQAYSSVLSENDGHHTLLVERGDITKSLRDPVNLAVAKELICPCLVVCAHVVAENSQQLRYHHFIFFQDMFESLKVGSLVVMTEATHRLWPEIVLVAFRASVTHKFGIHVAFPQVPGKRGFSLVLHKISLPPFHSSSSVVVPDKVEDLKDLVSDTSYTLLMRFKHDSDKHLNK